MDKSWDRIDERKTLWFHFKQGRNIAMFAPRRLGKSWLMKNLLLKEADNHAWRVIYCDLQNANTCQKAVEMLIQTLQDEEGLGANLSNLIKTKFKDVLKGDIKTLKEAMAQTDPSRLLDVVLAHLSDQAKQKPVLIMLDEVTICASNIMKISPQDAALLLNTLRKMRDAYPEIRWMLTGSIGIDHFAKENNMSGAFNNLDPFLIEPFNTAIARDFVNDVCQHRVEKPFALSPMAHQHLQKRLGWLSPFYLEHLCLKIKPSAKSKGHAAASTVDIDKACDFLLQYPHIQVFAGWPDHLARNISDDTRPTCKAILRYLSVCEAGESRDTIRMKLEPEHSTEQIHHALNLLRNDGFLKKHPDNGKFGFVMQLLADYWREYQE